jgi:hypothetical protein
MFLNKFRIKAGIFILILFTLLPNIQNSLEMLKTFPAFLAMDNVTINESRFFELKNYLKNNKHIKEVGYITELENNGGIFALKTTSNDEAANERAIDIMAQLILTQYTLSPVFVYNQIDLPYVVGNFPAGLPDKNYFLKKHLIPVKIFPGGVILLRNEVK